MPQNDFSNFLHIIITFFLGNIFFILLLQVYPLLPFFNKIKQGVYIELFLISKTFYNYFK